MTEIFTKNDQQEVLEALLRELREESGHRQIDVAKALGIHQSMVSKYEVGERRLDILELRALCRFFDITIAEFMNRFETRLRQDNNASD